MKRGSLEKSIEIKAPREHVWDVLLQDTFTRIWYAEFSPGTHAQTDWNVGSTVLISDSSGHGLSSMITANIPLETLSIEHHAVIVNGKENRESSDSKKWRGCTEAYRLSGRDGKTTMTIEQVLPEEYLKLFSVLWDKALRKIKELAESIA